MGGDRGSWVAWVSRAGENPQLIQSELLFTSRKPRSNAAKIVQFPFYPLVVGERG